MPTIERRHARQQLAFIAAVQVLGMATWFSASAVVPALRVEWSMSAGQATWLTASVQLGFVAGALTSAALNLPDRIPAYRLVAASSMVAALVTTGVALIADDLVTAVPLRFATGFALAGVYPPGLKLMASWFDRGRGLALGTLIGALALGSALPHLISVSALPWRGVLLASAGSAVAAAVIAALAVRLGPFAGPAPPFQPRYAITLFRERGPRLANLGYFGHMWELYAMWTWVVVFAWASLADSGMANVAAAGSFAAFLAIGSGAAGCVMAGYIADRAGKARVAMWAMIGSAACAVLTVVVYGGPPLLLYALIMVWGFTVVADSAQFSALVSEYAPRDYIGTALTLQTCAGFLLTMITIELLPRVAEYTGWRWASLLLVPGPLLGAVAMFRLKP